ncbi:MAG: hypothetical protein KDA89_22900 [Planctomycetaceae bacterium]|nr:hypothetical protein [Planctomycetaceae bacterium]
MSKARRFFETNSIVMLETVSLGLKPPSQPDNQRAATLKCLLSDDQLSIHFVLEGADLITDSLSTLFSSLQSHFNFNSRQRILLDVLPTEVQSQVVAAQGAVHDLTDQTAQLGRHLAESMKSMASFVEQITTDQREKAEQLETDLRQKADQREQELNDRERILHESEAKLQLREHRGVRRETLDKIKTTIEEQKEFGVSEHTTGKGRLIHIVCVVAMIGGLTLSVLTTTAVTLGWVAVGEQTFERTASSNADDSAPLKTVVPVLQVPSIAVYAPFASGMIIFGSTLAFYLRWLNYLYRRHAETEFQNLQFSKDILRASWIAEFTLEANNPTREDQQPFDVPEFLLIQFSKGLFESADGGSVEHPIEELQRYAKQFKKLTVGPIQMESKPDTKAPTT